MRWSPPATPAPACSRARAAGQLLQGVRRAALAAVYPTELRRGEKDDPFSLILDVGATIDATAEDLVGVRGDGLGLREARSRRTAGRASRCCRTAPRPARARASVVEAHARARRDDRAQLHRQHRGRSTSRAASPTSSSRSGFVGNVVLKMLEGVSRDRRPARALRAQGAARVAARPRRAVVGDRSAQGSHRLAAVRRRAAARLHASVHQGARPLATRARCRTRSRSRTRRSPATCAATSRARWPSSTSARSAALEA